MATVDFHTLSTEEAVAAIAEDPGEAIEIVELYCVENGVEMLMGEMELVGQSGDTYTYQYDFAEEEAVSGETYKVVAECVIVTKSSAEKTVP